MHLFEVEDNVIRRSERANWGNYHMKGDRHLPTPNEPAGLVVNYWLKRASRRAVNIVVHDSGGNEVATLEGPREAGFQRVRWDTSAVKDVEAGEYTVTLARGDTRLFRKATLRPPRAFAIGQQPADLTEAR